MSDHRKIAKRLLVRLDKLRAELRELLANDLQTAVGIQLGEQLADFLQLGATGGQLNAGQALDLLDAGRVLVADNLALDIAAAVAALVEPEAQKAVMAGPLVERWPWQRGAGLDLQGPEVALYRLLRLVGLDVAPGKLSAADLGHWPDIGLEHLTVAEWARGPLNLRHPAEPHPFKPGWDWNNDGSPMTPEGWALKFPGTPASGDRLVANALEHGRITSVLNVGAGALWPECLALLYIAERDTLKTRPGAFGLTFPLDVSRTPVRALTALAGADPQNLRKPGELVMRTAGDDAPASLTFNWADGEQTQLELPIDDSTAGPLLAVARKYGDAMIRDLLAVYVLAWARGAQPDGLWLWPDEMLKITGLSDTKENRAALYARIDRLHKTKLIARYKTGKPLEGPLLAVTLTDGTARRVNLHPALYVGIRTPDGKPGNRWWPAPRNLLALPSNEAKGVHVLALVAGNMFRAALKDNNVEPQRITAGLLADKLGLIYRDDRESDTRAGKRLASTLEAGVTAGLLAGFTIVRGELSHREALIELQPGESALALVRGDVGRPFPPLVPQTGAELATWLYKRGLSATGAGELLGVNKETMKRAARYGERPLQPDVRAALVAHLWTDWLQPVRGNGQ